MALVTESQPLLKRPRRQILSEIISAPKPHELIEYKEQYKN